MGRAFVIVRPTAVTIRDALRQLQASKPQPGNSDLKSRAGRGLPTKYLVLGTEIHHFAAAQAEPAVSACAPLWEAGLVPHCSPPTQASPGPC